MEFWGSCSDWRFQLEGASPGSCDGSIGHSYSDRPERHLVNSPLAFFGVFRDRNLLAHFQENRDLWSLCHHFFTSLTLPADLMGVWDLP